ncbi:hypothetical protein PE067_16195 [Paracoccus sp. DMF-8]|uniref:hypothetical protein n=1 Tax=Paracoccus sp. DMF-8 TaxID=3019445 RepID=UPI0023E47744|nr:hypothetical protein [Paracoccus sp. DMF-8]MDF3607549.1 hypothetical protein [Paracoccus sp. DMF-8]
MIALDLPPGMFRNGTDLQASGRWHDGNLVRWKDGVLRPVGGWVPRGVTMTGPARGAISWVDNTGQKRAAIGTRDRLYAMQPVGALVEINPANLVAGRANEGASGGFGSGFYGAGPFGVSADEGTASLPVDTWSLDTWGQNLIAVSTADKRILEWPLSGLAARVTNSPLCTAAMVTDERFLFALGADEDPRKVAWSDRENNTVWTADATNEAGDMLLQTQGRIMAGIRGKGQAVILTDQDAHTATYIAPPYVYRFDRVGSSCGLIANNAVAAVDSGVFWMGHNGFFTYAGGAVQQLSCDVSDFVFGIINRGQASKVAAVTNARWNEIWWFYPSEGSMECDSYVVFNYADQVWYVGQLGRTCGFDAGAFRSPVWCGVDGGLHNHESGYDYGGMTAWAETGPITLGDGVMTATMLIPDEKTQGQVQATFSAKLYPNAAQTSHGPYQMGEPTNVRFTGRQFKMRVEGLNEDDWRVGVMRLDVRQRGMR